MAEEGARSCASLPPLPLGPASSSPRQSDRAEPSCGSVLSKVMHLEQKAATGLSFRLARSKVGSARDHDDLSGRQPSSSVTRSRANSMDMRRLASCGQSSRSMNPRALVEGVIPGSKPCSTPLNTTARRIEEQEEAKKSTRPVLAARPLPSASLTTSLTSPQGQPLSSHSSEGRSQPGSFLSSAHHPCSEAGSSSSLRRSSEASLPQRSPTSWSAACRAALEGLRELEELLEEELIGQELFLSKKKQLLLPFGVDSRPALEHLARTRGRGLSPRCMAAHSHTTELAGEESVDSSGRWSREWQSSCSSQRSRDKLAPARSCPAWLRRQCSWSCFIAFLALLAGVALLIQLHQTAVWHDSAEESKELRSRAPAYPLSPPSRLQIASPPYLSWPSPQPPPNPDPSTRAPVMPAVGTFPPSEQPAGVKPLPYTPPQPSAHCSPQHRAPTPRPIPTVAPVHSPPSHPQSSPLSMRSPHLSPSAPKYSATMHLFSSQQHFSWSWFPYVCGITFGLGILCTTVNCVNERTANMLLSKVRSRFVQGANQNSEML